MSGVGCLPCVLPGNIAGKTEVSLTASYYTILVATPASPPLSTDHSLYSPGGAHKFNVYTCESAPPQKSISIGSAVFAAGWPV